METRRKKRIRKSTDKPNCSDETNVTLKTTRELRMRNPEQTAPHADEAASFSPRGKAPKRSRRSTQQIDTDVEKFESEATSSFSSQPFATFGKIKSGNNANFFCCAFILNIILR